MTKQTAHMIDSVWTIAVSDTLVATGYLTSLCILLKALLDRGFISHTEWVKGCDWIIAYITK